MLVRSPNTHSHNVSILSLVLWQRDLERERERETERRERQRGEERDREERGETERRGERERRERGEREREEQRHGATRMEEYAHELHELLQIGLCTKSGSYMYFCILLHESFGMTSRYLSLFIHRSHLRSSLEQQHHDAGERTRCTIQLLNHTRRTRPVYNTYYAQSSPSFRR